MAGRSPIDSQLAIISLAEAYESAGANLREYCKQAWPIVEAREFIGSWHVDAICDHVQAALRGQLPRNRLVINVPPRSSKSTITSVMAPTFDWVENPWRQWLAGSHNKELAVRDAVKSRRVIDSKWYSQAWGKQFHLTSDQNQKSRYENNKSGYRVTFGFSSGVTGEGGDVLLIDDPHPARASEVDIMNHVEFYDQELSTRLNNASTGIVILIMQRLRDNDLTGHILEKERDWCHLVLPMEFEPARKCFTVIGFEDPRKVEGELLCPARFPKVWLDDLKETLGTWGAAGQLQQRPTPIAGGDIKLEWLRWEDKLPPRSEWLSHEWFWDTAGTDTKRSSKWCGLGAVRTRDEHIWLYDMAYGTMSYPEGRRTIGEKYQEWSAAAAIIEHKLTGIALYGERNTAPELRKCTILKYDPTGDGKKSDRMAEESPAIEAGRVHVLKTMPYRDQFEKAILHFPDGTNEDIIDTLSMLLRRYRKKKRIRARALF